MIVETIMFGVVSVMLRRLVRDVTGMARWLWRGRPRDVFDDYLAHDYSLGPMLADIGQKNLASAKREDARLFSYGESAFWLDPRRYDVAWKDWLLVEPPDPNPIVEALKSYRGRIAAEQRLVLQHGVKVLDPKMLANIHVPPKLEHPFARNYAGRRPKCPECGCLLERNIAMMTVLCPNKECSMNNKF